MTDRYLFRGFHPCENGAESVWIEGEEVKGEWLYGDLLHNGVDYETAIRTENRLLAMVLPETVGQYICDDKHGKMIFTGDILKYEFGNIGEQLAEVYYSKRLCSFSLNVLTDNFSFTTIGEGEVIGNIHSNPDILGRKECTT